jgi:hypothetical protein
MGGDMVVVGRSLFPGMDPYPEHPALCTFMEPNANQRFRRIFNLYSGVLFLLATAVSIFAVEIISLSHYPTIS